MNEASESVKKGLGWLFGVVAVALAVGALLLFSKDGNPALPFAQNTPQAGLAVATALLVVTLFIERGMAAVNALIFGEQERSVLIALLADDGGTRAETRARLAEVLGWKERLRLLLGFAAGLLVAGAGVRTLAGLFNLTGAKPAALFYDVDILLTAGLIAGGSNGFAFLIQALKDIIKNNSAPSATGARATHFVTTG
jgi:hypothetical protein